MQEFTCSLNLNLISTNNLVFSIERYQVGGKDSLHRNEFSILEPVTDFGNDTVILDTKKVM